MGKRIRMCRICRKRQIWYFKGILWNVCKRCYHKHVWMHRPEIRKARKMGLPTPSDAELRVWAIERWACGGKRLSALREKAYSLLEEERALHTEDEKREMPQFLPPVNGVGFLGVI